VYVPTANLTQFFLHERGFVVAGRASLCNVVTRAYNMHVRVQLLGDEVLRKIYITVKVEKSHDCCRAPSVRTAFIPRQVGGGAWRGPVKTTRGALQNVLKTNISPSRATVETNAFSFYSQSIIYYNNAQ